MQMCSSRGWARNVMTELYHCWCCWEICTFCRSLVGRTCGFCVRCADVGLNLECVFAAVFGICAFEIASVFVFEIVEK